MSCRATAGGGSTRTLSRVRIGRSLEERVDEIMVGSTVGGMAVGGTGVELGGTVVGTIVAVGGNGVSVGGNVGVSVGGSGVTVGGRDGCFGRGLGRRLE